MAKRAKSRRGSKPVLLTGGNLQIANGYGDASIERYIAAMPGWKLIVRTVPSVYQAVKDNGPLYGIEGQGWFRVSKVQMTDWIRQASRLPGRSYEH